MAQVDCFSSRQNIALDKMPLSSEISDLSLFVSYFASQNKGIKFGDYFFDVFCVN